MNKIEIPELTSQQFGQMVVQIAAQAQVPGSAALQMVALQQVAQGLADGSLMIMPIATQA